MNRAHEAAAFDLPGGDRLVLYGFSACQTDRGTIVRLRRDRRLWTARPPQSDAADAFISLEHDATGVIADTWQGLRVCIDPDTGAVLNAAFVK